MSCFFSGNCDICYLRMANNEFYLERAIKMYEFVRNNDQECKNISFLSSELK